jgi:nitrate reductase NapE
LPGIEALRAFFASSVRSDEIFRMSDIDPVRKSEELRSFLFLTVVMVPVLTVVGIAAYGFAVWFYQMLIGGPPH